MALTSPSVDYFLTDYWSVSAKDEIFTFPGMKTPWFFLISGLSLIILIRSILPNYMKSRKPINTKSLSIIAAGMILGACSCGLLILSAAFPLMSTISMEERPLIEISSPYGDHISTKRQSLDIKSLFLEYSSFCLVLCKLYDFLKPIFRILSKKRDHINITHLMQLEATLLCTWIGAKITPFGLLITLGIFDTSHMFLSHACITICHKYRLMKPEKGAKYRMKKYIQKFRRWTMVILLPLVISCFNYILPFNEIIFIPNVAIIALGSTYLILYSIFFPIDI